MRSVKEWDCLRILFFFYVYQVLMCVCIRCVLYKEAAIQLKASGSEQRSLKPVGVNHIKQTAASKQLYRLCLIGEKRLQTYT